MTSLPEERQLSRRRALKAAAGIAALAAPVAALADTTSTDPVVAMVRQWYAMRAAYRAEHDRLYGALHAAEPAELREWMGVVVDFTRYRGETIPRGLYTRGMAHEHFDQLIAGLRDYRGKSREKAGTGRLIAKAEADKAAAIAEIERMDAVQAKAYRDLGVPFSRDDEENWWETHHFGPMDDLEQRILDTPATTMDGAIAKLMLALGIKRIEMDGYPDETGATDRDDDDSMKYLSDRAWVAAAREIERLGGVS